ncbi:hypothetical protein G5I_03976 [Acromyrmex echinatior]|uniref:Uncharacterized protein n=1 Tax=Acromyrmex echinatior TaxID=103372 RepID=F4WEH0_ACREC|nr:hypothetical protein G5I_03976 [Acromyrmex echinatior]
MRSERDGETEAGKRRREKDEKGEGNDEAGDGSAASYKLRVISWDYREVTVNRVEKIEESFKDGCIASVWSYGGNGGTLWHLGWENARG